jgi:hypothetical protein
MRREMLVMANIDTEASVTNKVSGRMRDHAASEMYIRDFEPLISDEPPKRGGNDMGPTPLELMLAALCA